ncbi:MAG: NosD domain-containing protein [Methanobacterium sp.]
MFVQKSHLGGLYIKKHVLLNGLINLRHNKSTVCLLLFILAFGLSMGGVYAADTDNDSATINTQNHDDIKNSTTINTQHNDNTQKSSPTKSNESYNALTDVSEYTTPTGRSNATVLENFTDISNWNALNNASISSNIVENDEGIMVTSPPGEYPSINKEVSYNFEGKAPQIQMWFYVYNESCSDVGIILYGDNKYFYTTLSQDQIHKGLNSFVIPQSSWSVYNGMTWNDTISTIELLVFNAENKSAVITFLSLEYNATGIPDIVLTFDDGSESIYTYAFPIMQQYGIKGTVFINPAFIGQPWYMTLAELQELHNAGWIIANHGNEHLDLSTLNRTDKISEIQTAINWLNNNGFGDGAYYYASAFGSYDDEVLEILRELGMLTHRTVYEGTITNPPDDLLQLPAKVIDGTFTLDQAKAIIDETIETKTTTFILLHEIVESNPNEYQWTAADFSGLIQYISQIGVRTLTNNEWYNKVTSNDTIAPTIAVNPAGGIYNSTQNVVLTANELANIYYTMDGSNPTISSTHYTIPIVISADTILKFFAIDTAGNPSSIYTETYDIRLITNNRTGKLYETLQSAIDDVTTLNGDTITVFANNLIENINIWKKLIIITDKNTTINALNPVDPVFTIRSTASGSTIQGFIINGSNNSGIYIDNSIGNTITNNTIDGQQANIKAYWGICIVNSNGNNIITNNTVVNCEEGINLYNVSGATITNNTIKDNHWDNIALNLSILNTITGNTISNADSGIRLIDGSDNNTISNNNLNGNVWTSISLVNSQYNQIINNSLSNCQEGTYLYASNNNTISNNTVNNNIWDGIAVHDSNANIITGHTSITGNNCGVRIIGTSTANEVRDNNINGNLWSNISLDAVSSNLIHNNTLNNALVGLYLQNSSNNEIYNNSIQNNAWDGIDVLYSSNSNIIHDNNISGSYYGERILSSNNNTSYRNNYVNNTVQAYDDSTNNWDNGTTGNYWSDWSSTDPRAIDGGSSVDNHPSTTPF